MDLTLSNESERATISPTLVWISFLFSDDHEPGRLVGRDFSGLHFRVFIRPSRRLYFGVQVPRVVVLC